MPEWQPGLDDWFSTHHGVISTATLTTMGVSARTIRRMVDREQLVTMLPGVFRSRQWPDGPQQRLVAVSARNPFAAVAFTSAARAWKYRRVRENGLHVLVPHGASPELEGVVVHRCRRIDPVDIVERADGIRLTSPPRTLFDSADMLGFEVTRSVLEQILHEGICTLGTITDTFARLYHPHRPGSRTLAEVIRSRPAWRHALHSDLELRVLTEIERQGLPTPQTQCPITLPGGRIIHVDFGWPEFQVGLEVDHPAWHTGEAERHRDVTRDRRAAVLGWTVTRIARLDVDTGGLVTAIGEVAAILSLRRAS